MKLTPQERKVYTYIRDHHGCTTRDIQRDTWIECPSARITGLRQKGVDVQEIGKVKYPGARPFTKYAIGEPIRKRVEHIEIIDGRAVRTFKTKEI